MRSGCADSWVTGVFFWAIMFACVGGVMALSKPLFRALPFLPEAKPILNLAWSAFLAFWLPQFLIYVVADASWQRARGFVWTLFWGIGGVLWLI